MRIEPLEKGREKAWDDFVASHADATFFHRVGWRDVISRATGHREAYRLALEGKRVVGILPLFFLNTRVFGKMAVSLPFLNVGGIVAESPDIEQLLADEAKEAARGFGCRYVELRQRHSLKLDFPVSDKKVTSVISLEGGSEGVFARLHQNVRNKIRKSEKAGLEIKSGPEFLDDFYRVYSRNLRDLGTPVLSRRFFRAMAEIFPDNTRVYRAERMGKTIGAKIAFFDGRFCYFVWAAAVRRELRHAPVHALNWAAIRDACEAGCETVDLGRSTRDSSHQDFKKYWGVAVHTLPWTYQLISCDKIPGLNPDNPKFRLAIRLWRNLPVSFTRMIGPPLARLLP